MGRLFDRLKTFAQGLSGRLILGWLLINGILVPLIFLGVVYIVQDSNKDLFLDHARSTARLIADMLEMEDLIGEWDEVASILQSAQLSGQLVYAEVRVGNRALPGRLWDQFDPLPFREDLGFGQHGDSTYFMSMAIDLAPRDTPAVLRLGFDEQPTRYTLRNAYQRTVLLIALYVVLSIAVSVFVARRLTRPIEALRRASHRVASGHFEEHLEVPTHITEVQHLARDLDTMRNALVEQAQALHRANETLQAQQARLQETETLAAIGQMASVVAHSIRNPLASIRTSAELALEIGPCDMGDGVARDIIQEADRMDHWIREFLSFTRPGEADLDHRVDLNAVIQASLDGLARGLEKQAIAVEYHSSSGPAEIRGERRLLEQMMNSLLCNAMEAMPGGGRITLTTQIEAGSLGVEIADTGAGMSEQQLQALFQPYYTSKQKGLGLGLMLVKRIVSDHGGSIAVASEKGVGTTVRLVFPVPGDPGRAAGSETAF